MKTYTQKELDNILIDEKKKSFDNGLRSAKEHYKPSPTTLKFIETTKETNKKQWECINKIDRAMFGFNDEKGVEKMVKEMHKFLFGLNFTGKAVLWFFGGIATIAGGIFGFIKIILYIK